jgi:hypothetical protein
MNCNNNAEARSENAKKRKNFIHYPKIIRFQKACSRFFCDKHEK